MNEARQEVVGVVLAGGASRRMGHDKALLEVGGKTLVERAVEQLGKVCDTVVVAAGASRELPGFDIVADAAGHGPAAGILGAAAHFERPVDLLVLACDLPAVTAELLAALIRQAEAGDWILPRWRRGIEPLCSLYRPPALAALARRVEQGRFALHGLRSAVEVAYLEGTALRSIGRPDDLFCNLNDRSDFERWITRSAEVAPDGISG